MNTFTNEELALACHAAALECERAFSNAQKATDVAEAHRLLKVAKNFKRVEIKMLMAQTGVHSDKEIAQMAASEANALTLA